MRGVGCVAEQNSIAGEPAAIANSDEGLPVGCRLRLAQLLGKERAAGRERHVGWAINN